MDYEIKRQKAKQTKNLIANLLELTLTKKTLIYLKVPMKYLDASNKRQIN